MFSYFPVESIHFIQFICKYETFVSIDYYIEQMISLLYVNSAISYSPFQNKDQGISHLISTMDDNNMFENNIKLQNSILIRWESNLDKNMGNDKKIFEYFCLKLTPTVQQVYTWSTKKIIPNGHFFVIRYMLSIVWFIVQNKWLQILRFLTRWKVW